MKVYGVIALLVVVAAMGGLVMAGASTNLFLSDDTSEPQIQNEAGMIPDIEPKVVEAVTEPVLVVEQPRQEPAVPETPKKEKAPKINENQIDREPPKIEKDETPKYEPPAKSEKEKPAPKSDKDKPEKEKPAPKSEKKTEPAKPDKPAPKKHAVKYDEEACLEIIGKMLSSTDPSPEKLAGIERELKAKNCGNN